MQARTHTCTHSSTRLDCFRPDLLRCATRIWPSPTVAGSSSSRGGGGGGAGDEQQAHGGRRMHGGRPLAAAAAAATFVTGITGGAGGSEMKAGAGGHEPHAGPGGSPRDGKGKPYKVSRRRRGRRVPWRAGWLAGWLGDQCTHWLTAVSRSIIHPLMA